jgi:hypothetical protein
LDINNSTNISEKTVLPVFPNSNFIIIEETVVLLISTAEEDEMAAPNINIE